MTAPDMALRLDAIEALNLRRQVESLEGEGGYRWEAIPGGVAAFCATSPDRKLNHIVGLGMAGPIDDALMTRLEDAYRQIGAAPEIYLCPHSDPSVLTVLASRGYKAISFTNTYGRVIQAGDLPPITDGVDIRPPEDLEAFVALSADGFGGPTNPRPRSLLESLARSALSRADTRTYVAFVDGQPAGSAAMAILEQNGRRDGHFFLASTLPAFRARGVQAALLAARVRDARSEGVELVSITARPGNVSARNSERAGFSLAYTQTTFRPD